MLRELSSKLTMVQAISQAMDDAMRLDPNVVLLGQDVGQLGGVFRASAGLLKKFGPERVIDTPLAESAIVGSAVGMALYGLKPIAELQFSGFSYQAFHQIENHVSRYHNRTRGQHSMSVVIRMPYGGGVRAFEHHSESREAYFIHTPGLKVVIPSSPREAYGLLRSAIASPDPVIFMEPKKIYRAYKETLLSPTDPESVIPLGQAKILQTGTDLTLVSYGAMVPLCLEVAQGLAAQTSIEVIDLRTLSPLDEKTILNSVQKTGRAVIVHEAPRTLGLGAELSALLTEKAFYYLKAPIKRVTGYDSPVPYFSQEEYYLPNAERIQHAIREVMKD